MNNDRAFIASIARLTAPGAVKCTITRAACHHCGIAVMTLAVDELIEQLAATQMGLVTRTQLRECGIAADVIDRRVRATRLRQVHRGVYRVGPLVAPRSRELAAVLACGPHAILSHRSAGPLWLLLPADESAPIDIIVSNGCRGRRPGILVHRVSLAVNDVTILDGIRITSPQDCARPGHCTQQP
jgi:putative AbiEi antitoxin of type IV toxin-antitoxin system